MEIKKLRRSCLLDALIVLLAAIGAVQHFQQFRWTMFQYYTLCSNVFLMLACAVQLCYEANILLGKLHFIPSWVRALKYFAVCTVLVTFTVVIFILVPMAGGLSVLPYYLFHGAMLYHHTLCPILGFISFVIVDRVSLPDRRVTLWALVPTLVYAVVATILNAARVLYGPYPFLHIYEQPVWMSAVWYVVILGMAWVLAFLVWKLSLRFAEPRDYEDEDPTPEPEAWTADGYLQNQDALHAHTYRTIPASNNACGPVANYNLRHREGHDVPFTDVLREMDDMHLLRVPGPTFMYVMRQYLRKYLPGWREVHGRDECLAAAGKSRMGVFRYHERTIPHFVAYYRTDGGAFRFLNIWDDLTDVTMDMAKFGKEHLVGGSVKLIYWE